MPPDDTLEDLAAYHALTALPAVWIDLAHGRVSADEAAAVASEDEPAELVARSRALFSPPSPEQEHRRLEALLDAYFPEPRAPSHHPRWPVLVLAALAACVLLALVPLVGQPPTFDGGYAMTLRRGHEPLRDATARPAPDVTVYLEGRRMELRLQPLAAISQEIGVKVFASAEGQSIELHTEPRINASGVIEIVQTTEALGLSVGHYTLTAVVGPIEHLPSTLSEVDAGDPDAPYDVVSTEIEIVPADDVQDP